MGTQVLGSKEFSLDLSVGWDLGGKGVSRYVTIDGKPIPQLDGGVSYSELDAQSSNVDYLIAEITQQIMMRIETLASG